MPFFNRKNKRQEQGNNKSYFDEENDSYVLRGMDWPEWPAETWILTNGADEITVLSVSLDEDGNEPIIQTDIPLSEVMAVTLDDEDYRHVGFGELRMQRAGKDDLEIAYDSGYDLARKMYTYLAEWISNGTEPVPVAASAVPQLSADELAKELGVLQNLVYSGILTEEEFAHKKRTMLGM